MPVESIGTTLSGSDSESSLQRTGLGQEDFLKIFLAQLSFQDPLEPVDNQQFMAQMAQFASLDQSRQLNENMEGLLTVQSASQSIGLIGKTVQLSTTSGSVVGSVTTVTFNQGAPELTVKTSGDEYITGVSLSQVSLVRNEEE